MAGQRSNRRIEVVINGHPVLCKELVHFDPPEVKKITEDEKGGQFVASKIVVGVELGDWSMQLLGVTAELLAEYGAESDQLCSIDVQISQMDSEGKRYKLQYSMDGEILSAKEEQLKMGSKPGVTLSGHPTAYKKTENGRTCYDINTRTQKCDLGKGDILADDRL